MKVLHLYSSEPSGNCYKIRLILAHLGIPYETTDVDVFGGGDRPEGLSKQNPWNRVPLLVLDDGRCLPESNAILWHLAQGTDYFPTDPHQASQALRWMFFEQNIHESTIAVNRFLISYAKTADRHAEVIEFNHRRGTGALAAMEAHLQEREFFAAGRYTIADIALYAYTHVAGEGNFDLGGYAAIRAWLDRVRNQPGHVPMTS
jgi:glutathione S-transferase